MTPSMYCLRSRCAVVAGLSATLACGGGSSTKPKRDLAAYCSAIGDHMERRFAHAGKLDELADRAARLATDADTPTSEHVAVWQHVTTAASTLEVGARLGMRCLRADPMPNCVPFYSARLLLDRDRIAELASAQTTIADGLRGQGQCAVKSLPDALREQDPCDELRIRLSQGESKPGEVDEAERGWDAAEAVLGRGAMPPNLGSVRDAVENSVMHASERRALVDYAIELLPYCIGASAAKTCDVLRNGLEEARPKELQRRLKAAGRALNGRGCST